MDFERYVAEIERGRTRAGVAPELGRDNLVVLARTVSTNLLARVVVGEFESEGLDLGPMLVLALEQSGGRGRHGRSWSSPRGRGVYATLAQPFPKPELLPALPLLAGVGLCRALAAHLPHGCRLKWPNDLLVPPLGEQASGAGQGAGAPATAAGPAGRGDPGRHLGRKIGGILIEAMVHPGDGCVALIGFGVNHGQRQEELPDGATSLLLESGGHLGGGMGVGLAELTWDLVGGLERELAHAGDLPYAVAAYRELVAHRPGDRLLCRVGERRVAGTFAGIDDAGRLRLRFPQTVGDGSPAAEAGGPAAGDSDPAAGEPDGELLLSAGEVIAG
ncbi:MAG TPA: biotin--[acetyl-CoA-carboxylase] ligase [Thermoanaerobaculia bacterium]|nr:biotin--[acetyl-CoA-carboxylase] ligase [Thermoanaerobaculia bacterium]